MHTINVNVVRGRSYENLSYNSFMSWKLPDLQYLNIINFVQMLRSQRLTISCHINHSFIHSLVFQSEFHLAVSQQRVGLSAQLNPLILGVELTDITEQFLRLCYQTEVFVKLCYHCSNSEGHPSPTGMLESTDHHLSKRLENRNKLIMYCYYGDDREYYYCYSNSWEYV